MHQEIPAELLDELLVRLLRIQKNYIRVIANESASELSVIFLCHLWDLGRIFFHFGPSGRELRLQCMHGRHATLLRSASAIVPELPHQLHARAAGSTNVLSVALTAAAVSPSIATTSIDKRPESAASLHSSCLSPSLPKIWRRAIFGVRASSE